MIPQSFLKRDINIYLDRPDEKGVYTQTWIRQEDFYKIRAAQILKGSYLDSSEPFQQCVTANVGGNGQLKGKVNMVSTQPLDMGRPFDSQNQLIVTENEQRTLSQRPMTVTQRDTFQSRAPAQEPLRNT